MTVQNKPVSQRKYPGPKPLLSLLERVDLPARPDPTVYPHLTEIKVNGIAHDSRRIKKGDAFFCLTGETHDGNQFIDEAIAAGVSCIFSEQKRNNCPVPCIVVPDARLALAKVASYFFDYPSRQLRLIGVTGTNGKTTTTHLIEHMFLSSGLRAGLIGTLGARWSTSEGTAYQQIIQTTPEVSDVQSLLYQMVQDGVSHVAMEWSSHALALNRAASSDFAVACLTNITQDHLDFHKTMEHYWKSKLRLFEQLEMSTQEGKTAIVNNDDPLAHAFVKVGGRSSRVLTYGWDHDADVRVIEAHFDFSGTRLSLKTPAGKVELKLKLNGRFNVYNVMAALITCLSEGLDLLVCKQALEGFLGVPGRFQIVSAEQERRTEPLCIVDYAHTPDGLDNILKAARALVPSDGRLIAVFGCGGDRDSSKRPQMGEIAEQRADVLVITSDNPRTEDPQAIIYEILAGIKRMQTVNVELDRYKAIHFAIEMASDKDVIVVAGKGHETFQILKDKVIDFDDRKVIQAALEKRAALLKKASIPTG